MTWLITGSEGRLGRAVTRQLEANGVPIRTFDRVASERAGHIIGDLTNPGDAAAAVDGIDTIVHLAALPSDSAGSPAEILKTNVLGTIELVERAVRAGCGRVVYASSINALGVTGTGRPDRLPVDAEQKAHPASPYQISKLLAEEYLLFAHRSKALEVVILRPPFIADSGHYMTWSAPTFDSLPRTVSELFAYVDLDDCARAFLLAAQSRATDPGPYLLSAADTCSAEPTRQLLDLWSVPVRADFDASLGDDENRSLLDFAPATAALGWRPTTSWRAASTAPSDHAPH